MTDPVADMLARIRNANVVRRHQVDVPGSRLKRAMAQILREEGFIENFQWIEEGVRRTLRITLKYGPERRRVITGLRRISRPGLRVYVGRADIPRVLGGLGLVIVSTSKGIMTGTQAKQAELGGEILAYVW